MAKAYSEPTDWAMIRAVDRRAQELWQYGQECFSAAWLRAWEEMQAELAQVHSK